MSKFTPTHVTNILGNPTSAAATINANLDNLSSVIDLLLSRDGASPNTMTASLDMNSHRILNLPTQISDLEPARLRDIGPPYTVYQSYADAAISAAATATAAAASLHLLTFDTKADVEAALIPTGSRLALD